MPRPHRRYWVFFGSSLVALEVEPLGCDVLLEPLLEVEPPEADPDADFSLSFSASVVAELELDALGALEAPDDGLVLGLAALGELELLELALPPALGELAGGVDGVDDALLLEPDAPGAVEVRSRPASSPQAARPRANATATANVESLMCPPRLGTRRRSANIGPGVSP